MSTSGSDAGGDGGDYVVEQILQKRKNKKGKAEYLLKWKGFSDKHNTWQELGPDDCPDLLIEFERKWAAEQEAKKKNSRTSTTPRASTSGSKSKSRSRSSQKRSNVNGKSNVNGNGINGKHSLSPSRSDRSVSVSVISISSGTTRRMEDDDLESSGGPTPKRSRRISNTLRNLKKEAESDENENGEAEASTSTTPAPSEMVNGDRNNRDRDQPIPPPVSKRILDNAIMADMTVFAKDKLPIPCHQLFLRGSSPVIDKMFFLNEGDESGNELKRVDVDMSEISEEGVRSFLRFLYYNDLQGPKESVVVAYEMWYLASKYQVAGLEDLMMKCLSQKKVKDLSVKAAFNIYTFGRDKQGTSALKEKTVRVLMSNLEELEQLPEYKELFRACPDTAMELSKDLIKAAGAGGYKRK